MVRPILAITPGDPDGIGPEIVWKTIQSAHRLKGLKGMNASLLCVGARKPFDEMGARVIEVDYADLIKGETAPSLSTPHVWLLPAPTQAPLLSTKKKAHLAGFQSGWSIQIATHLVQKAIAAALVTGPISKERLQAGGFLYPGHTEFLAELCKVPSVTMMLANETLRISLVTTHLALKAVPEALNRKELRRTIQHTLTHLREGWGIRKPRIAVLALNPHAGESGLFGDEEIKVIEPELKALRKKWGKICELTGPHPADTLFAKHVMARTGAIQDQSYDAVVCMYHDQGLIPVKLLDFPKTVNVTLGLPMIRTSVDHGVGFDIAKKGIADPSSLQAAIKMALKLVQCSRSKLANPVLKE